MKRTLAIAVLALAGCSTDPLLIHPPELPAAPATTQLPCRKVFDDADHIPYYDEAQLNGADYTGDGVWHFPTGQLLYSEYEDSIIYNRPGCTPYYTP